MNESEWNACTQPRPMLFGSRLSDRKHRLFAAACCRRVWELLPDELNRIAVDALERYADGRISAEVLALARESAWSGRGRNAPSEASRTAGLSVHYATSPDANQVLAETVARDAAYAVGEVRGPEAMDEEAAAQAGILCCVAGMSEFRPIAFDPRWRTSDTVALARAIYDDRAFERLPILADALMDTGCENEDILGHCRSRGPHVRGCWVVDLVLGKE